MVPGRVTPDDGDLFLAEVDDDELLMSVIVADDSHHSTGSHHDGPGGFRSAAQLIQASRRHPLGTCERTWSTADTRARSSAAEHDPYKLWADDASARMMLRTALLGPSSSALASAFQILLTVAWLILTPATFHVLGFSVLTVVTMALMGLNGILKLMGLRFQTFADGASADNATVRVWRVAPAEISEPRRVTLARNLSFGARTPGGGPQGNAFNTAGLLPLALHLWPTLGPWQQAVCIATAVLSFFPQLGVPVPFSQTFLNSCATLAGTIDRVGIWEEEELADTTSPAASPAPSKAAATPGTRAAQAFKFKEAVCLLTHPAAASCCLMLTHLPVRSTPIST